MSSWSCLLLVAVATALLARPSFAHQSAGRRMDLPLSVWSNRRVPVTGRHSSSGRGCGRSRRRTCPLTTPPHRTRCRTRPGRPCEESYSQSPELVWRSIKASVERFVSPSGSAVTTSHIRVVALLSAPCEFNLLTRRQFVRCHLALNFAVGANHFRQRVPTRFVFAGQALPVEAPFVFHLCP